MQLEWVLSLSGPCPCFLCSACANALELFSFKNVLYGSLHFQDISDSASQHLHIPSQRVHAPMARAFPPSLLRNGRNIRCRTSSCRSLWRMKESMRLPCLAHHLSEKQSWTVYDSLPQSHTCVVCDQCSSQYRKQPHVGKKQVSQREETGRTALPACTETTHWSQANPVSKPKMKAQMHSQV